MPIVGLTYFELAFLLFDTISDEANLLLADLFSATDDLQRMAKYAESKNIEFRVLPAFFESMDSSIKTITLVSAEERYLNWFSLRVDRPLARKIVLVPAPFFEMKERLGQDEWADEALFKIGHEIAHLEEVEREAEEGTGAEMDCRLMGNSCLVNEMLACEMELAIWLEAGIAHMPYEEFMSRWRKGNSLGLYENNCLVLIQQLACPRRDEIVNRPGRKIILNSMLLKT